MILQKHRIESERFNLLIKENIFRINPVDGPVEMVIINERVKLQLIALC